jgi:hypothetical protein
MRKFLLATGVILLAVVSAAAQEEHAATPKVEVYGGYSYLRLYGENNNGGEAAVTGNVNEWFGVTGSVSGYHAQDGGDSNGFALAGPRFTYRRGAITPFAHFLFGAAFGGGDSAGAMALGGGVDAKINEHFAIRLIQADYVATTFRSNNGRVSAGIVFRFGER